jgi:putative ABC transport system permease protein
LHNGVVNPPWTALLNRIDQNKNSSSPDVLPSMTCGKDAAILGQNAMSGVCMMKYMPLVWAALWRNRTESLLTLLALVVGFALFTTMIALNAAYERSIADARMDRLLVMRRFEGGALPLAYREQLSRIAGVTAVGGQLWLGGHEKDERHQILVMFVDDGMRAAWPELPMSQADWRSLDTTPAGIFLTRMAAARRAVRLGDVVTLTTAPGSRADGGGTWYFTVLGIIPDPPGWGQWNPDLIVGNLRYFQESSRLDERSVVNTLRVSIDRPEHARAVCREIEARFTNASVPLTCVPARENAEELAEANINMRQISLGIGAAGLFMILFLWANGTAESVRERLAEFGVLKTIGYGDASLALIVFLEAAFPTVLAALVGIALARGVVAVVTHLAVKGVINIPAMRASAGAFGLAIGAALLIALVSSVGPMRRIWRMDVAAGVAGR